MPILADVYSYLDTQKRKLADLLRNPGAAVDQAVGNMSDQQNQQLNDASIAGLVPGQRSVLTSPEEQAAAMGRVADAGTSQALGGTFMGPGSKIWRADQAAEAMDFLKNKSQTWRQTGTAQGPEGKLRQEIADQPAALRKGITRTGGTVSDYLNHPELFEAYPSLAKLKLQSVPGASSEFNPNTGIISIGDREFSQKSALLHELQHGIQQEEGFAQGGSPTTYYPVYKQLIRAQYPNWSQEAINKQATELAYQQYRKLGGEVESRIVQKRFELPVSKLSEQHPYMMGEIPLDQMVVKQGGQDPGYQDLTTRLVKLLRSQAGL